MINVLSISLFLSFLSMVASFHLTTPFRGANLHAMRSLRMSEHDPHHFEIEYCTGCKWLLKSAYFAQEILTTFEEEVDAVTLKPHRGQDGSFTIYHNGEVLWDRRANNGFPNMRQMKNLIRDKVSPAKNLGHTELQEGVKR